MKSSGRAEAMLLKENIPLCFPSGLEKNVCNLKMKLKDRTGQKLWLEQVSQCWQLPHQQHGVYRSASLPTETIFSIPLVGLTKHCVFEVYQTLGQPCRPEGELNHLIYWVLEYTDTPSAHCGESENLTTSSLCFYAAKCLFWIAFIFRQATPPILCHFGLTQGSKKHQVPNESSWFQMFKEPAPYLQEIPFKWRNVLKGPQLSMKCGWLLH